MTNADNYEKTAMKVSIVSVIWNLLLSAGKLFAGIFANSGAMISDAVHSASDVFSTIIVMIGVKISGKDSDNDHPYGHERLECVAAIILATVLAATGIGIGYGAVVKIMAGDYNVEMPGILHLWQQLSMLVKGLCLASTQNVYKTDRFQLHLWLMHVSWSQILSSISALIEYYQCKA